MFIGSSIVILLQHEQATVLIQEKAFLNTNANEY